MPPHSISVTLHAHTHKPPCCRGAAHKQPQSLRTCGAPPVHVCSAACTLPAGCFLEAKQPARAESTQGCSRLSLRGSPSPLIIIGALGVRPIGHAARLVNRWNLASSAGLDHTEASAATTASYGDPCPGVLCEGLQCAHAMAAADDDVGTKPIHWDSRLATSCRALVQLRQRGLCHRQNEHGKGYTHERSSMAKGAHMRDQRG